MKINLCTQVTKAKTHLYFFSSISPFSLETQLAKSKSKARKLSTEVSGKGYGWGVEADLGGTKAVAVSGDDFFFFVF